MHELLLESITENVHELKVYGGLDGLFKMA